MKKNNAGKQGYSEKGELLKKCPKHQWYSASYKPYAECQRCGKRRSQKAS